MNADIIERMVRPEIRALSAYHVPDPQGLIKLDAMENPYTWPQWLVDEWLKLLQTVSLNRYPDPRGEALKGHLRASMALPDSMGLLLGNGSDELIQLVALALAKPGATLLAPEPSFVMYQLIATFAAMHYVGVPLDGDFGLDRAAMRQAIAQHKPAVVFLAYPNNPTGNLFDPAAVMEILELAPGLVVVDEAYHAFAGTSFLPQLGEHDNLLVMRTLSKLGLAGLRLGLLAGPPEWLTELDKLRLPYNINVLTQASAALAMRHSLVLAGQTALIRADRERLSAALAALPGITVYPSRANFILCRVPAGQAHRLHSGLKDRGVLVKNLDGSHARLQDCLRVTVGRPEENAVLLTALKDLLVG